MMMRLALGGAAMATALALGASVAAQNRHDSAAPIDFDAATLELQDRANRAILSGGVTIRQANMTLTAARVVVAYTGELTQGDPQVSRLDASGGVTVTRPDQSARGDYAVYDVDRRAITMAGGVTLTQGPNRISGGRLTIDLDSGRATIDGAGVGGGGNGVSQSGGRVQGRFSVPRRDP